MSRTATISKKSIIDAAIEILRENGAEAVNARSIAARLGCSTQPIFSNFATMDDLQSEVIKSAYELYFGFLSDEAKSEKYPKYKSFGMAYIRFAKEEKELFKLLFMRDRNGEELIPTPDFEESTKLIMNATGASREKAHLLHLEMWISVHGIATMLATSFFEPEWELISDMISDIYQGLKTRLIEGK